MNSFFSAIYKDKEYEPILYAYYDRADMLHTTKPIYHAHGLYEIMYVSEGRVQVRINDDLPTLGRRQYIWLDALVPHQPIPPEQGSCSMMNIEYAYQPATGRCPSTRALYAQDPAFTAMMDHPSPYLILTDTNDTVYTMLKEIVLLADSTGEPSHALCSFLCVQIMALIAAQWKEQYEEPCQPIVNPYVSRALAYLRDNYAESITAQSLASALGVQPGSLQRLFKRHTGQTIVEQLHRIRMNKARQLLLNTNYTILEVAASVGISSQQYFARLFRHETSLTPTEYRRQAKQGR